MEHTISDSREPEFDYSLEDILAAENAAEVLSKDDLKKIGQMVVTEFKMDDDSRSEWKDKYQEALKLAMQVYEPKTSPWPGASNIKLPVLTSACMQFNSRAYPALVMEPELVKCRVVGDDPTGQKEARAMRVGTFMSWQLLEQDDDWAEDTDRLMMALPIVGFIVRKSYYDPIRGRNDSEMVLPEDFVVSYYTRSLEYCPRATHVLHLSKREIRNRMLAGVYLDTDIGFPSAGQATSSNVQERRQDQGYSEPQSDPAATRDVLEQHRFIDLDGDGYEEPYVVTVDRESAKVLRLFPRFTEVDIKRSNDDKVRMLAKQAMAMMSQPLPQAQTARDIEIEIRTDQAKAIEAEINKLKNQDHIIHIEPIDYFTKYPFIPAPDGSFYDVGFGALLAPICGAADTLANQLIDAGTLQVSNVGFLGGGIRVRGGDYRFRPFEWKKTDSPSGSIKENIVPLPVNAPSGTLFELLKMLLDYAQQLTSVTETMQGQMPGQNTPATTAMTALDQGMKVFSGILKRLYRSLKEEFRKLYKLNQRYLDPMQEYTILGTGTTGTVAQSDFAGNPDEIVPEADPTIVSDSQRLQRVMFLAQRAQTVQGYDPTQVEMRILKQMHVSDPQQVFPGPPKNPPPDPKTEVMLAEAQRKALESHTKVQVEAAQAAAKIINLKAQAALFLSQAKSNLTDAEIQQMNAQLEALDTLHTAMMNMAQSVGDSNGANAQPDSGMATPAGNAMVPASDQGTLQ